MKQHAKFLFLSLLIHAGILFAAVYSYQAVATTIISSEHKKMPISLNCIIDKPKATKKEKKVEKKAITKKVVSHKVVKKKVVKEKIVPKKIIKPIVEEVPQKVSKEEKTELKEVPISKEVLTQKEPQKEAQEDEQTQECSQRSLTQEVYINHNVNKISQLISDNLYYPRSARKRGIQGEVVIKFRLLKDATISSIEVIKSNHEILARAAKTTIKRLSGKFPKPSNDLVLTVPINYTLH